MSALGRRDDSTGFWFGLEKINQTWVYANNQIPSYSAINWHSSEPYIGEEVAYFRTKEGYSDDLLTQGSTYTGYGHSLCEYNCKDPPTLTIAPTTSTPEWPLSPVDCSAFNDRLSYQNGSSRYDVLLISMRWQAAHDDCKSRGGSLAVTGMGSMATRM